ncbi:hypothetical protein CXF68_01240 [Tenacibaculum sp. Bg11-29]|uniref:hypothetical protein n=1 Tax=Tenacibaculum sp. Bg11-29 TaxID=2058306 RepID=UPI000C3454FE|nr:hypothetical protein [Tenacibaculum sp. Bg11-29]PKH49393.1 hypothetical protein CXF68_01240 [Tenacibaculum sp. Bg11-29]
MQKKHNWIYIALLFIIEIVSVFPFVVNNNVRLLMLVSFFVHFVFFTIFYFSKVSLFKNEFKVWVISIGVLVLLTSVVVPENYLQFDGRFVYSLTITFYSLMYFYSFLKEDIKPCKYEIILNSSILFFFCIDAFLAIATSYLINNNLTLVSWFWFFRAVFLQLFYISFVYYLWKILKVQ